MRYFCLLQSMNRFLSIALMGLLTLFLSADALSQEVGIASFYTDALTGRPMANGDLYDPEDLTCAHQSLPFGSILKVAAKNKPNHSVMVIVTDRGPFVKGRIIDLSRRAAQELGILQDGLTEVIVAVVKKAKP